MDDGFINDRREGLRTERRPPGGASTASHAAPSGGHATPRRVLLVDAVATLKADAACIAAGLGSEWHVDAVTSAAQAMQALASESYAAVITEMRIPGGAVDLLKLVCARHPDVVRLVMSQPADQERALLLSDLAHQYLRKPCHPRTIGDAVSRATALRDRLDDPALLRLVSGLNRLPSIPAVYHRVRAEVSSGDPSLAKIAHIIQDDPGMSAKVLQLVNSAFFGLRAEVVSVPQAVGLLGIDAVMALMLGVSIFGEFGRNAMVDRLIDEEWTSAMLTATAARAIARHEHLGRDAVSAAYLAGLLHNAGRLVLAVNHPGPFASFECPPDLEAEQRMEKETFGGHYPIIGAHLLAMWSLPLSIVEAVAFHRTPMASGSDVVSPLTAVHVAWAIERRRRLGNRTPFELDVAYLDGLGAHGHLDTWIDVCESVAEDWAAAC